MFVYAGIDEAGYGPLLGPLCVGCSVFVIPDHAPERGPCDLWLRLNRAVCRKRSDRRRRIAVDDSKNLKGAPNARMHPLRHLERGVLSFLAALDHAPECDHDLFTALNVTVAGAKWYHSSTSLPVAQDAGELRVASSRLRAVLAEQGVRCELLQCEAIDVETFNQQVEVMGTKAGVNFCAAMRMVDAIWRRWPRAHPRIIIDHHGARIRYLNPLLMVFPEATVRILGETETLSRYRLERNGSQVTLTFEESAESANLPVALASMTAKYVRELFMIRLNRYFQSQAPELKPTAGYWLDARRYLTEIEPLIQRLGVERRQLVRSI